MLYEVITIIIFFGYEKNKAVLTVEDFGVGIEDVDKIFQAYYQHSSKKLGLGLGLNIVKEICDKYEIQIEVNSEKNRGSCFKFFIDSIVKSSL